MFTLLPQLYYICDPCYIIDNKYWNGFCDCLSDNRIEKINFMGVDIVVIGTMEGDGSYSSNKNIEFDVDAGIIAAIPFNAPFLSKNFAPHEYYLYYPDEDLVCDYQQGTLKFGDLEIYTMPVIEEVEEED